MFVLQSSLSSDHLYLQSSSCSGSDWITLPIGLCSLRPTWTACYSDSWRRFQHSRRLCLCWCRTLLNISKTITAGMRTRVTVVNFTVCVFVLTLVPAFDVCATYQLAALQGFSTICVWATMDKEKIYHSWKKRSLLPSKPTKESYILGKKKKNRPPLPCLLSRR